MFRRKAVALCTALSVATTGIFATPALAQANPIYRVVLGVGADETQNTVSWRTHSWGAEALEFFPTDHPEQKQVIEAREQDNGALLYRSMEATMTGLQPATRYTYRVGSDAQGWSAPQTFTTSDFDSNWNFVAFADPQIGVNLGNLEQGANWRRAVDRATADVPDAEMMLSLGDQVDGWGAIEPQYDEFFSPAQLRTLPVGAIAGNHETYMSGIKHFQEHFSLPNEVGDTGNYFYERNNVLFISLNSNRSTPAEINEHIAFLRDTVAKHGAANDWVVLSYHHGPFSQGSHVSDGDVVALREALTPVISELGINVVLSGHDHIYTRSHLMRGTTPVTPAKRAERGDVLTPQRGDVLYLTTTTAGGGKYYDFTDRNGTKHPDARRELIDPALEQPWTAYWRQDYTPDYLRVAVTSGELTLTTYNVDTPYVVDKVTLKNFKAAVTTPAPTTTPSVTPSPTAIPATTAATSTAISSPAATSTAPSRSAAPSTSNKPTTSTAAATAPAPSTSGATSAIQPPASPTPSSATSATTSPTHTPTPQPCSGSSCSSSQTPWWVYLLSVFGVGSVLGGLWWWNNHGDKDAFKFTLPEIRLPKLF